MDYTNTDEFFGVVIFLSFMLFIGSIIDFIIGGPAASYLGSAFKVDKGLVSLFPFLFFIFILIVNFISYYYLDPRNADFDKTTGEQKLLNEKLRESSRSGDLQGVGNSLSEGAEINAGGLGGRTALMNAVHGTNYKPNFEIVKYLVENGADVNGTDAFGNSVIQYAYSDLPEYGEAIEYLQAHGAGGFPDCYYPSE
ncbi:ankyrin repeat domain-containing protein [Candidatus Micrarchaeota archaeon]|nr:ankyrin repeat domain-containing protein [Candidatus Micrarchaeota archaeon]